MHSGRRRRHNKYVSETLDLGADGLQMSLFRRLIVFIHTMITLEDHILGHDMSASTLRDWKSEVNSDMLDSVST